MTSVRKPTQPMRWTMLTTRKTTATTATQTTRTTTKAIALTRAVALSLTMLGAASAVESVTGSATAAAAPGATSQEAMAKARGLADQGRVLHDRGEYGRAVDSFQAAYVLAPSPALLFNLGQAYRLKGDCDNALLMYRAFLRSRPAPQLQDIARAHLGSVEKCASPEVMGRPAGATAATPATSAVTTSGSDRGREPGRALRRSGVITAISGGVLLGLAGYFAYRAADANDEVEERYGRGVKWRDLEELDASGDRDNKLATGLAVTGGVAVITGSVLYLVGWRQGERAERRPMMSFAPARGGGAVRLAWTF
jgi:tetratricopeptide (TPR) repeat protein